MRRRSGRSRRFGITRSQLKIKHQADCNAGKHTWRPININYANYARCEYCGKKRKTKMLSKNNREIVREIAKLLRKLHKKVDALYPRKKFNKDGY